MLKVVKAKKYQKKKKKITKMAGLISGHPVQKSIAIHFHPCNPVLLLQNTCSILFFGIFLTNLFVYLMAFGNYNGDIREHKFL